MLSVEIAQVCHEANRALQIIQSDPTIGVGPEWYLLDQETRDSATNGVEGVLAGNTPEQSHENWCSFKQEHGWTIGVTKDEGLKKHPLLVPYALLPATQKIKDALFVAIVNALS